MTSFLKNDLDDLRIWFKTADEAMWMIGDKVNDIAKHASERKELANELGRTDAVLKLYSSIAFAFAEEDRVTGNPIGVYKQLLRIKDETKRMNIYAESVNRKWTETGMRQRVDAELEQLRGGTTSENVFKPFRRIIGNGVYIVAKPVTDKGKIEIVIETENGHSDGTIIFDGDEDSITIIAHVEV